jgi:hypothetical protein
MRGHIMKTKLILFSLLLLAAIIFACTPVRIDGPYKGRVIDAETGQPIQGAVVLGVWYTSAAGPGGGSHTYYDAAETVTDKDGNFEIKGLGLKIMTTVKPMNVVIFKAGYEAIGMGTWSSLNIDGGLLKEKVKWDGNRAIIPMKKLTMAERRKLLAPPDPPAAAPFEKVRYMLKEIDKNDIDRGLPPRKTWKGNNIEQD